MKHFLYYFLFIVFFIGTAFGVNRNPIPPNSFLQGDLDANRFIISNVNGVILSGVKITNWNEIALFYGAKVETTNWINQTFATNTWVVSILDNATNNLSTNLTSLLSQWVEGKAYVTINVTNGLASTVFVDTATNNLYISITNWVKNLNYITQSITNGLASIFYVDSATNNLFSLSKSYTDGATNSILIFGTNWVVSQNYTTASITNSLASRLYVDNSTNNLYVSITNWVFGLNYITQSGTNGLASLNYVDNATNGVYVLGTNWITSQNYVNANITNGLSSLLYVNNAINILSQNLSVKHYGINFIPLSGSTILLDFAVAETNAAFSIGLNSAQTTLILTNLPTTSKLIPMRISATCGITGTIVLPPFLYFVGTLPPPTNYFVNSNYVWSLEAIFSNRCEGIFAPVQ